MRKEEVRKILTPNLKDFTKKKRCLYVLAYLSAAFAQAYMISFLGRRLSNFHIFAILYILLLFAFIFWLEN